MQKISLKKKKKKKKKTPPKNYTKCKNEHTMNIIS